MYFLGAFASLQQGFVLYFLVRFGDLQDIVKGLVLLLPRNKKCLPSSIPFSLPASLSPDSRFLPFLSFPVIFLFPSFCPPSFRPSLSLTLLSLFSHASQPFFISLFSCLSPALTLSPTTNVTSLLLHMIFCKKCQNLNILSDNLVL